MDCPLPLSNGPWLFSPDGIAAGKALATPIFQAFDHHCQRKNLAGVYFHWHRLAIGSVNANYDGFSVASGSPQTKADEGGSMKIHGQSEFNIYASPLVSTDGASIIYNVFANFDDNGTEYTYNIVDGAAYLTAKVAHVSDAVRCLRPDTFPFDQVLRALNDATPIPSASIGNESVECASGNLLETSFAGQQIVICESGKSGFFAANAELLLDAEYLSNPVEIAKPLLSNNLSCKAGPTTTVATPATLALLTGKPTPPGMARNLKEASHLAMAASTCTCKSTPRPCIFLHGLGNPNEEAELQDTPKLKLTKKKFGDIGGHAPCCTTVKYAVLNTVDYGWTNDTLQQKLCDFSLSMSDTSDQLSRKIEDTIVVTHSMGGLVMATALAKGVCSFNETSSWVSMAAPMMGTMAGDLVQDLCNDEKTGIWTGLFKLMGECPASVARKSISYENEKYSTPELNAAYAAAREAYRSNVTAALCSNSYYGVVSNFSPLSTVAGKVIPHKSK
ncbi:unnamed protein product [Phytophthora lilii]|uniref:Unnamed protein product n=1 Tax=Phytophthora lilii TaxID=2077276 RepID=A0A9W6WZH3_9STRA|nr:unnamed protein product [Phytophthora lilii]